VCVCVCVCVHRALVENFLVGTASCWVRPGHAIIPDEFEMAVVVFFAAVSACTGIVFVLLVSRGATRARRFFS